jgi:tetratricopeptide (TPR) repeat protein
MGEVITDSKHRRSAAVVGMWKLIGFILAISSLVFGYLLGSYSDLLAVYKVIFSIVYFGLVYGAVFCYRHGKKLKAVSAIALTEQDKRPPVLYLRSFKDDSVAAGVPMWTLGFVGAFLGMGTEEEQLAQVLNEIGPFIALGRPTERLPQVGAARIYVSHDEWQDRVTQLMSQARLVVLRAGTTAGLWWEVKTAVEVAGPEKLLFVMPFTKKQYATFRRTAKQFLPCCLPDYTGGYTIIGSRLRAILYFDHDWTAHLLKIRVFSLSINPLVSAFQRSFQPVIEHLGLKTNTGQKAPLLNRFAKKIPGLFLLLGSLFVFVHSRIEEDIQRSAEVHNEVGCDLYEKHNVDRAIGEFRQALRLRPQLTVAHLNLAFALHEKGEVLDALLECSEALRLDPALSIAHNYRGLLYYEIITLPVSAHKEFSYDSSHGIPYKPTLNDAILEYREALRLQPDFPEALQNLGDALREKGDVNEAIMEYEQSLRLQPSGEVYNNLGFALYEKHDLDGAIHAYHEGLQLQQHLPELHENLGNALRAKGDLDEAIIEYRESLRLRPTSSMSHNNLAVALEQKGYWTAALQEYEQAYRLAPNDALVRQNHDRVEHKLRKRFSQMQEKKPVSYHGVRRPKRAISHLYFYLWRQTPMPEQFAERVIPNKGCVVAKI